MGKGKKTLSEKEMAEYYINDYKLLREESLQCMRNQNQLSAISITFLAAYSLLIQFGLKEAKGNTLDSNVQMAIFSLIVPLIATSVFTLYLHEAIKMMKVGAHLRVVENQIHKLIKFKAYKFLEIPPLNWENSIKDKGSHSMLAPLSMLFIYATTAVSSMVFSWSRNKNNLGNSICILIVFLAGMIVGIFFIKAINIEFTVIEKKSALKLGKRILQVLIFATIVKLGYCFFELLQQLMLSKRL